MVHHGLCPPAAHILKLFAILLSGKIDANVAEIWFIQMQNCISWNTNEDDDQTLT